MRDYFSGERASRRSLRPLFLVFLAVFLAILTWPVRVAKPQSSSVQLLIPARVLKTSPSDLKSRNLECVAGMKEIESLSRQSPRTVEDLKELEAKLERTVKALRNCDARIPALIEEHPKVIGAAEAIARRDGVKKAVNDIKTGGLSRIPGGSEMLSRIQGQLRTDANNLRSALNALEAAANAFHKANVDKLKEDAKRRRASVKDSEHRTEGTTAATVLKPVLLRASFAIEDSIPSAYAHQEQFKGPVVILSCAGKVGGKRVECHSDFVLINFLLRTFGEPTEGGPSIHEQCLAKADATYDRCSNSVKSKCDRDCDDACDLGCDLNPFVLDKDKCKRDDCVPNQGLFNKACEITCDGAGSVGCSILKAAEYVACAL